MPALFQAVLCFLADGLARLRRWLTVRRVLHLVALLVILLCLRQFILMGMGDVAFWLGMDWGLALEVTGVMMLLAARTHTIATVQLLRRSLWRAGHHAIHAMRRGARAFRTRTRSPRLPPASDDEPAAAWRPALAR